MNRYRIAVIPGDGIGVDVTDAALLVIDAAARRCNFQLDIERFPWGCEYYLEHGEMMPADGLRRLHSFDAIFLGAVGYPALVPDHVSLHGLLLPIRQRFDQSINLRPHRPLPGVNSPLRTNHFDILVVRENSEGEYVGAGGRAHDGTDETVAIETAVFTRRGCDRVMRFAFEQARRRAGRLACATKSNAQRHSMVFWDEIFAEVAERYPDIDTAKYHIDALCARMITHPESLDVIVASNLFGDILSDIGAAIQGGLGFAASGNINPTGRYPSMFEPVHGSAPDIAGKGIANPCAAIWSTSLMLDHLDLSSAARAVMTALEAVTGEGNVRTPDMGGTATTQEMAEAIASRI